MNLALRTQTDYFFTSCATCKMEFYLPDVKYNDCKQKGEGFYCPNGHSSVFRETELQKAKRELELANRQKQWAQESRDLAQKNLEKERKRSAAFKGVLTKTRNRIGNGVCPCCSRSFQNLKRHMDCKHPEFKKEEV